MKFSSDEAMTFTTTFQATPETLELLCGIKPGQLSAPQHAVTLDRVERMPGNPPYPVARTGWRRVFDLVTGRRRHELHLWAVKYRAWRDAGCPDIEQTIRVYIPRAIVRRAEDHSIEIGAQPPHVWTGRCWCGEEHWDPGQ